jgi:hypothetical protein
MYESKNRQAATWFSNEDLMDRYGFSRSDLDTIRANPRSQQLVSRTREFWKSVDIADLPRICREQ